MVHRPSRATSLALLLAAHVLVGPTRARAHADLYEQLPADGSWAAMFDGTDARARVKDGLLIGLASERAARLPDGNLQVRRDKTYYRVKHPKTGKVVKLPDPWRVHATLVLTPALRLLRARTTVHFPTSIDRALDYPFSEELGQYFDWDEARTTASQGGTRLTLTLLKHGAVLRTESYDYEPDDIPIEIIGLALGPAIQRRIDHFDFDLLLPDGSTHGVRADVHRVNQLAPYAKGYPIPKSLLSIGGPKAVVTMRLSSPLKYLLFPYKFYLVYDADDPADVLALWGGKPDEHLQAFKIAPKP